VQPGDVTQRVGVEVIRARGVDVEKLIKMLVANAAAEFASTYYYYTILRMNLAGHEDYKEICEDARLEDRAHWELIVPRIYELGGNLPNDLREFHDQAGCRAAKLPDPPTAVNILTLLGTAQGTSGSVEIVVEDARRARKALDAARISYQETPAEQYELPNKAGSLAQCLNQLAAKGVNMNSICAMAAKGGKKAVVVCTVEAGERAATATA